MEGRVRGRPHGAGRRGRACLKADKSGDETNYLYGKALENARRVALILAVGRDARQPSVTGGDAVYACALVRYLVDDLIRAVRETVAETGDEKAKKRILQVVASAGRGGITKKELTRRTQFIRKSFRDEYLDDLVSTDWGPDGMPRLFNEVHESSRKFKVLQADSMPETPAGRLNNHVLS